MKQNSRFIQAAGGLLWRMSAEDWQIAIIHRQRYNDWSFPKGKLKTGESWHEAALREVLEETGYSARLQGFAGAVAYTTVQTPKVVRFWHMIAEEKIATINDDEVDTIAWLSRTEALSRLKYPLEQALLEVWLGPNIYGVR